MRLYSCGNEVEGLHSCGNREAWDYTAVRTESCGTIQLWEQSAVGLYSCGNRELWDYTAVEQRAEGADLERAYT